MLTAVELEANRVSFSGGPDAAAMRDGSLRWIDGPQAGLTVPVSAAGPDGLVLETELDPGIEPGARALLREGCDHTMATCHDRFANSVNFQGEPFLPGNDLVARSAMPSG